MQSIGGGIWMITMLALDHWGLEPKRDRINFRIVGDEAVLGQALVTNVIGLLLELHLCRAAQETGLNVMSDLAT